MRAAAQNCKEHEGEARSAGKHREALNDWHEEKVEPGAGLHQEITDMKEWAAFAIAVCIALLVQMLIVGL